MTVRETVSPTDGAAIESSPAYPGWRVVAVCFAIAVFAWGFGFYGHGFYLAELQREHGWPASVIASATTAFYLFGAVTGAFAGDVLARFGTRPVVLVCLALTVTSASLIPIITAPWQLYAAYGLMAFGWAGTSLTAITTILGMWFNAKRGLAISIGLTGASFGGILVVPLLAVLTERVGFAPAVQGVALVFGLLVAGMAAFWLRPAPHASRRRGDSDGIPVSRGSLLRSAAFWAVSAPFALAFITQVGFLVHQITLLTPVTGRAAAGLAVAVTTATAVCGRLVLGAVVDRLDQRVVTAASFASQAAALGVLLATAHPALQIAASAVFGFSVGNIITLPALIIQREFPARDFAIVAGLSNAVCQIAYSFGPALLGILRDLTGGYGIPLVLCIVLDIVAAGTILLGRSRRHAA